MCLDSFLFFFHHGDAGVDSLVWRPRASVEFCFCDRLLACRSFWLSVWLSVCPFGYECHFEGIRFCLRPCSRYGASSGDPCGSIVEQAVGQHNSINSYLLQATLENQEVLPTVMYRAPAGIAPSSL